MNTQGEIVILPPPLHLPPPPRRTDVRGDTEVSSVVQASVAGYSNNSSPTKSLADPPNSEINTSFKVHYLQKMAIDLGTIGACYPAYATADLMERRHKLTAANRLVKEWSNRLLSTTGPSSSNRWFARLVIGVVSVHDYHAHMYNIQREILGANIDTPGELPPHRRDRIRALKALRLSLICHKKAMIRRIDFAITEAGRQQTDEERESLGDWSRDSYMACLQDLRAQYASVSFWAPVEYERHIPDKSLRYVEEVSRCGSQFYRSFWCAVMQRSNYFVSFWADFRFAIVLPSVVLNQVFEPCSHHMQDIFVDAAHHSWMLTTFRIPEHLALARARLQSPAGWPIGRRVDATVLFSKIRQLAHDRAAWYGDLSWEHIPVWATPLDAATIKKSKRKRSEGPEAGNDR